MPLFRPPRVSVLLPVKNAAGTLPRAIQSCLDQSFSDFEILAVDDESSDDSFQILEEWAKCDVRVIPLRSKGGLVPALSHAFKKSRGEFLARMDADDFSWPERFSKQIDFLDRHADIDACGTRVRIVRNPEHEKGGAAEEFKRYESWINQLIHPEDIARERFIESPLVHPSMMLRRGAFQKAGGYRDTVWAEDYDLWLRMFEKGMRFAKLPELLLDWTDSPKRLTRASSRYSLSNFRRAKAHYLARLERARLHGAAISGAGPTGKELAGYFFEEKIKIHAFYDVHPGRIGKTILRIPVHGAEEIPEAKNFFGIHVGAVGQWGARDQLRKIFESKHYQEGLNFFCAA